MSDIDVKKAYINLFSTPDGQIVLGDMMTRFGSLGTSYAGNVNDCIFKEGERNVVNFILHSLQFDVQTLLKQVEKINRKKQEYMNEFGE